MKAAVWHGRHDVRVDTVDDPKIQEPTDAIIEVTSSGICGSDLHLYDVMAPFMEPGDILGHEPMGIVREVGDQVTAIRPGDRVVVPFNISCGNCPMCLTGLQSQCETTQLRVRRWVDAIMPLLSDDADPLGVDSFATHRMPLDRAAEAYQMFQEKRDGAVKILLRP